MRALQIAGTGMLAQQTNVEVIANNIANVSTTAFSRRKAEFQDLIYQSSERVGSSSSEAGTVLPVVVHLHGGGYRAFKDAKRAERQRWEQRFAQEEAEHDELAVKVERAQSWLKDAWRPPKGAFKHKRSTRAANKMRNVARRLEELDDQRVGAPPPPLRFTPPELEADDALLHATSLEVPGRLNLTEPISLSAG